MKIIKPSVEILSQEEGLSGIYKMIEIAGRTCYKSEDKITEDSSIKFVQMLIDREHTAMLEHGTVYLKQECNGIMNQINPIWRKYESNKYSKVIYYNDLYNLGINSDLLFTTAHITTNYRVLVENGWLDDLQYQCEPTEYHEKRITVKFNTQIAISREYNRHRVDSIAESSTRYCNYSKDKFGNEITINIPSWIKEPEKIQNLGYPLMQEKPALYTWQDKPEFSQVIYEQEVYNWEAFDWWLWSNKCSELAYMNLIRLGWTAQQARTILPLDTNTELIHTAFVSDWKHFFSLRCVEASHPDARELAIPLQEEFKELNII